MDGRFQKKLDDGIWRGGGDFSELPEGGIVKQWCAGVGVALLPVAYGIYSLSRGFTRLYGGKSWHREDVYGRPGMALAVGFIALGAFLHVHYFWGLSERRWRHVPVAKIMVLLVFIASAGYALWHIVFDGLM